MNNYRLFSKSQPVLIPQQPIRQSFDGMDISESFSEEDTMESEEDIEEEDSSDEEDDDVSVSE